MMYAIKFVIMSVNQQELKANQQNLETESKICGVCSN